MLDNDVDIINMSFGELVPTGVYDSDAAYADYIVNQYKVTVVAAAGNEGEDTGYVCNPSLGYNVISLGAANDGVIRSPYSSYLEAEGSAPKPTLMLVGSYVANRPLGVTYSGTSVSSACASGIIALLMEQHPNLKTNPERLQALLCSSARMHPDAILLANGFNEPTGAGMIHYENFNTQYANSYTIMNYNGRSGNIIHTRTVDLTGGTRFKCSIAWTAYATGDVSRTKFTNYNIYLKDSEGNILAVANSTNSCIELITCIIPEDGTYKIEIEQIGTIKKINEKIGVAYGTAADYEM
jgi:subtilisin family serine protease